MKCLKYHLTFLPQILHATEQRSPQIRDNVCIMYVDIEVSTFLYIRYSYTYTDCWCDNDNLQFTSKQGFRSYKSPSRQLILKHYKLPRCSS